MSANIGGPVLEHETIFCDESSLEKSRFKAWGGVWVRQDQANRFREAHAAAVTAAGWRADTEIKWKKASGARPHPAYVAAVDAFFEHRFLFNCLVVDRNNPGPNRGDDVELDYYKSVYWLIHKRVTPRTTYRVVLDDRTNHRSDRLSTLRDCLNHAARRDYDGGVGRNRFSEVVPADSEGEPLLQIADLLLGAVAYHMNKRHRAPKASPAKQALAQYIAQRATFVDGVLTPTSLSAAPVNVWLWASRS